MGGPELEVVEHARDGRAPVVDELLARLRVGERVQPDVDGVVAFVSVGGEVDASEVGRLDEAPEPVEVGHALFVDAREDVDGLAHDGLVRVVHVALLLLDQIDHLPRFGESGIEPLAEGAEFLLDLPDDVPEVLAFLGFGLVRAASGVRGCVLLVFHVRFVFVLYSTGHRRRSVRPSLMGVWVCRSPEGVRRFRGVGIGGHPMPRGAMYVVVCDLYRVLWRPHGGSRAGRAGEAMTDMLDASCALRERKNAPARLTCRVGTLLCFYMSRFTIHHHHAHAHHPSTGAGRGCGLTDRR